MTKKQRMKNCDTCGGEYKEKPAESEKQWNDRCFCSISCRNKSKKFMTCIFVRLENFQVKKEGCWGWSGSKDCRGYGVISSRNGSKSSPEKAHRVSYEKAYGKIPEGLNVCHRCDNPECTNPEHLFVGTQKENMSDCSSKGRLNAASSKNLVPGKKHHRGAGLNKNKVGGSNGSRG